MIHLSPASRRLRTALAALATLVVAGSLVGCQRDSTPPPSSMAAQQEAGDTPSGDRDANPWSGTLVAIPQPNLSVVADDVRHQIEARQAALERLQGRDEVPAVELGANYGQLGNLYHAYEMFDAAEACYRNAHLLAPHVYRWPHYLGYLCQTKKAPQEAIEALERALELRPNAVPTLAYLGASYLELNQPQRAAEFFSRALAVEPSCAVAIEGLGKVAMAQRTYPAAVEHFEKALQLQPGATAIHYSLAMAYRGVGDLNQANLHLEERGNHVATVADPLIAELPRLRVGASLHGSRGLAAGKAGKLAAAIRELRKAIQANPHVVTTRVNLGTALTLVGDLEAAEEEYRAAIRLNPNYAQAYYNLAVVLGKQGAATAAIQEFRQAVQLDPQYFGAHLGLAEQLLLVRDFRGAAKHFGLAVEIDPRHQVARVAEAVSLARTNDYAAARKRLEEARRVLPKSMVVAHGMARLLAAAPDADVRDGSRALPLALAVFQTRESTTHAATVAMAYAEVGQFEQAIQWQQRAVAAVEKSGSNDQLPWLRRNLVRYVNHQPCRVPWPPIGDTEEK